MMDEHQGSKVRYISDGTWFDKGTECVLICDCVICDTGHSGLFSGIRGGKEDEEGCSFDEFTIVRE